MVLNAFQRGEKNVFEFLSTFAKLPKASMRFITPVRLFDCPKIRRFLWHNSAATGGIFVKF
jgi:hypothetical protein